MRSSCSRLATHYETLAVPQNATRAQIKSSFYRLSKKYHPDVNSDPAARATFRAISEAYSILGHDRERRTYDRTLADPPLAKPDYNYTTFYETRRRRGPKATYAWEPRRSSPSSLNQQSSSSSSSRPHRHDHDRPGPSPFFHPGQKHSRKTRQNSSMSEQDGVVGVSSFWRAVQVSGLIAVVIAVGGAFGK